jgi:hypothetical protein
VNNEEIIDHQSRKEKCKERESRAEQQREEKSKAIPSLQE